MDWDEEADALLDELAEAPTEAVSGSPPGPTRGTAEQARQAGDDAVEALAKVTAGMANGEQRSEQQEMCRAVGEAIVTGTHLVVQAGTGTGKSLAYLVPAVLSGRKVVVATATKALQDQLAEKDLPLVDRGLGLTFSYAVLKGRSNYICRQRVNEVGHGGIQPELSSDTGGAPGDGPDSFEPRTETPAESAPEGLVNEVRTLLTWADTTRTGDRADLSFEPSPRAWSMVSVGPRECPGAFNCPSGKDCFAEAARDAAAAADVVVVNTHLYGAHLASGGAVLPEHDVVVFDETHELEEVMTSSLGVEITPGRFRALALSARSLVTENEANLLSSLLSLGDEIGDLLSDRIGTRVLHDAAQPPVDDRALAELLGRTAELAGRVTDAVRRSNLQGSLLGEDSDAGGGGSGGGPNGGGSGGGRNGRGGGSGSGRTDLGAHKTRVISAASHLTDDLHRLLARTDGEVAWVDGTRRNVRLRLSPIDVGPVLESMLWGEVTAVLTSATVPPLLAERVGLQDFETNELNVGSPFDYRAHSLLYVARHLPDRRSPQAEAALHTELALLIAAAGGRTLALFTSRRATEEAAAALAPDLPYQLLLQGELPKGRLLEEFARNETSCLFATLGFWQGVDIPGRSLSLVTLDRLPFPRPDDPLLQARRARAGSRAFSVVDLPRAATLLAQGAGRLIRSADDRGVVAVLDSRLATSTYRGVLLATLPPMRRTVDRFEVEEFLREALAP
jgi:ATP-dependent DNA helicase DinG